MTRISFLLGATLAVGGLLTTGPALIHAQDEELEGIIRISDSPNSAAAAGLPADCPNGTHHSGQFQTGNCPSGACPAPACGHGPRCHRRCRPCRHFHGFLSWLDPYGPGTVSPDHGWAPPGKTPIYRRGVPYNKFFPDAWTGQPAAAPAYRVQQVYMPTDTTQLGYYYQHVPYWQPNPAMIPPAPSPRQWHQPLCGPNGVCGVNAEYVGGDVIIESAPATETAPVPPAPADSETSVEADLQRSSDAPTLQPTPGHAVN